MRLSLLLCVSLLSLVQAGVVDDATGKLGDLFISFGTWMKEKAAPAAQEKVEEVKETLQDPETHKKVYSWISEKADAAKEFIQTEIVPEAKKIFEAGKTAAKQLNDEGKRGEETTTTS